MNFTQRCENGKIRSAQACWEMLCLLTGTHSGARQVCRCVLLPSFLLVSCYAGAVQPVEAQTPAESPPCLTIGLNPHFFDYGGQPVALFGSGLWTILPDTTIDIEEHNAWYAKHRSNANRITLFAFCTSVGNGQGVAPWKRVDGYGRARDGGAKFD